MGNSFCESMVFGWSRDSTAVRALALIPPMWPGFDSRTRRHIWVEFVIGSRLYSEKFFSGYSGTPLSSLKNQHFSVPIQSGKCPELVLCTKYIDIDT